MDENNLDGLIGRGEARLKAEEWEDALRAFEQAFEASGRNNQEIAEKVERARRLLKQARQKDYYKVLGISRDADQKTIKKGYRKATMSSHPDKGGSEAKMAAVNEAYEVLSNPELRARFDRGDDPNDPTQGQGGHPFNFGGGPFQNVFFQTSSFSGPGDGRRGSYGNRHFNWGTG